jgi:hypothetical protein
MIILPGFVGEFCQRNIAHPRGENQTGAASIHGTAIPFMPRGEPCESRSIGKGNPSPATRCRQSIIVNPSLRP